MKSKDLKVLNDKSIEDLMKMVKNTRTELVKLRAEYKAGKLNNPKKIREIKKNIAQILTLIKIKEILARKEKQKDENI
jgi:large subunit ribosomal protein L29